MAVTGEGVATSKGRAVFIEGAFAGEEVRAQVSPQGAILRGELLEVAVASPARRVAPCPLADRCGGCDWQAISEAEQRRLKEILVRSTLERLGGLDVAALSFLPTVHAGDALGTRRRAAFHVRQKRLALFGRRSHETVEVDRCPALTPPLQALPSLLSDVLGPVLRDVDEVLLLETGGAISIALVLKTGVKPAHREAAESARRKIGLAGVVLFPAEGKGGSELVGKPTLRDGETFLRPDAFTQAHGALNAQLVHATVQCLQAAGATVLELYCGNGNFTLPLAKVAQRVVAVESFGPSLALGQEAVTRAGLENIRWIQRDAEKTALALAREGERFDRLLVDPPRAGCPKVAEIAKSVGATRVVYVACDPASLARDAKALIAAGYLPASVQLFDMFPQTHHVETVMTFNVAQTR